MNNVKIYGPGSLVPCFHQKTIKAFAMVLLILMAATIISSCKKTVVPPAGANLTIVNAVVGCYSMMTNFNGGGPLYYNSGADQIGYGLFYAPTDQFNYYTGQQHLALYNFPDTLKTDKPIVNISINLPSGSIHTLFVSGTLQNPDTMFVTDNIPYHPLSDSAASFRFVNLSKGSNPVSINLTGQPSGSVVNSLPYKGITKFINFPATSDVGTYTFEFRDMATDTLIAKFRARDVGVPGMQYAPNNYQFRSNTIELFGTPNTADFFTMQRTGIISNY
ncbi:MAG: hypothetical protein JWR50_1438 [Mucilaginibacter sp.]|nr:hypothetical protein [Mucilaginibacter sp.]